MVCLTSMISISKIKEIEKIRPLEGKKNILLLHSSVGKQHLMDEYGEQLWPMDKMALLGRFDYVALGHWHNFQQVKKAPTAWYSGSTERMSESEIGHDKGICWLDWTDGESKPPAFIPLQARGWHKVEVKKCADKEKKEIVEEILDATKGLELGDGFFSLHLSDLSRAQALDWSTRAIQTLLPDPVHLFIRRTFVQDIHTKIDLNNSGESLNRLFQGFIARREQEEKKQGALIEKAAYYFDQYENR